jgi:FkbM family methyltransferase
MSINTKLAGFRDIMTFDNWPMLLLERLIDRRTGLIVYQKNGLEILIDHRGGDEAGTRCCITSDMYRRYLPHFSLPRPSRVLDLGANGGGFPLMLKLAGIKLDRVVCVEMNPLTYSRLLVNVTTNIGPSTIAINAAVCGMRPNSEILLKSSRGGTGESIYDNRPGPSMPQVAVRTTTLQALYDQYFSNDFLDICKIDIEGAEYDVFESCPDDVMRKIRYLVVEFHDASRTPATLKKITNLGFVAMGSPDNHQTSPTNEVRVFHGPEVDLPAVRHVVKPFHVTQ